MSGNGFCEKLTRFPERSNIGPSANEPVVRFPVLYRFNRFISLRKRDILNSSVSGSRIGV